MQAFLKKLFHKDIIAIIQNVIQLILNWIKYTPVAILNTIFAREKIYFQDKTMKIEGAITKKIFADRLQTPIIIYQPGKVGSITVHQSLKVAFEKRGLTTPIHHAHNLNDIEFIEESVKQTRKSPEPTLKKLAESKVLRQEIDANPSQKWNIISLVRDPVALRVSTMFQILDEYIPDWPELRKENKLSIADLQQLLLTSKEFNPIRLSEWFDKQVKNVFGFDVFATPFDIDRGYKIYQPETSRFSFMIVRLEDLDRIGPQAFNKFLKIRRFQIINQNIGEQKPYSKLYKEFKSVPLPVEYLDIAYNTPYAQHFYTAQEIETFRNRWLNPQAKKES